MYEEVVFEDYSSQFLQTLEQLRNRQLPDNKLRQV